MAATLLVGLTPSLGEPHCLGAVERHFAAMVRAMKTTAPASSLPPSHGDAVAATLVALLTPPLKEWYPFGAAERQLAVAATETKNRTAPS